MEDLTPIPEEVKNKAESAETNESPETLRKETLDIAENMDTIKAVMGLVEKQGEEAVKIIFEEKK